MRTNDCTRYTTSKAFSNRLCVSTACVLCAEVVPTVVQPRSALCIIIIPVRGLHHRLCCCNCTGNRFPRRQKSSVRLVLITASIPQICVNPPFVSGGLALQLRHPKLRPRWPVFGQYFHATYCLTLLSYTTTGRSCITGFPGDLPNVIKCVHELGYVPMKQTLPMICCSLFSIAAGGSLGPEAPLVAISASACGWLSINHFKHDMVLVRKCTIIGMSAGLSAFFGVQLGGKCTACISWLLWRTDFVPKYSITQDVVTLLACSTVCG